MPPKDASTRSHPREQLDHMPATPVQISRRHSAALIGLCKLGNSFLDGFLAAIRDKAGSFPKPKDIKNILTSVLPKESAVSAVDAIRVLVALATIVRKNVVTASEVLNGVSESVVAASWTAEERAAFEGAKDRISALIAEYSVVIAAKTIDLTFDHSKFLMNWRIISDIRPVFNLNQSDVIGATICHVLRIEYADGDGGDSDLSLILDSRDIEQFQNVCKQALEKAAVLQRVLSNGLKVEAIDMEELTDERD